MRLETSKYRSASERLPRRASVTVELILTFPILFALFLGMIEFSMLLYARQQLTAASREGARVAALGGESSDVEQTVRRFLGAGRLGEAEISLTDAAGEALSGDALAPGEPIEVWVRLPASRAVPDLLRFVGYSIRDEEIVARTVMRRE